VKVVRVRVHGLGTEPTAQQHVVVLQEEDGTRVLPIFVGDFEANAIARLMHHAPFPRPLTHDLIALLIEGLHARVSRVVIDALREGTYHATLQVVREQQVLSVDARPSDSIAIALRTGAPLFVNEELLQEPTVPPDDEPSPDVAPGGDGPAA
jgi:bifunctional DNase/RNase